MAYDSPKLDNYTFKHPPKPMNVAWFPQLVKHQLADGSLAVYNKGFILKGSLEWGRDGWIDQDDYSNIAVMFTSLTATAKFYPRPDTYPTKYFNVQITSDFNFVPHGGDLQVGKQLYEGSIAFESSIGEITSTTTNIF
jgi:hypothetical protein